MKTKLFVVIMVLGLLGAVSSNAVTTIKIIPSFGPPPNADSYSAYTVGAASTIRTTGTLPTGVRTSPTDARILQGIAPEDLMRTLSLPFYRGDFSPVAPFHNERGGTVFWWIEVDAGAGQTVSLADLFAVTSSSDGTNNVLHQTMSFVGTTYSVAALGVRENGTVINSGPADQLARRVIVAVISKWFTVGSSTDVQGVRAYWNQYPNLTAMINVSVKGTSESKALSKMLPRLNARIENGNFVVSAMNNGDPQNYEVQVAPTVNGPWTSANSTLRAGEQLNMGPVSAHPARFVRLIAP